jgi:hypothetical protein
MGQKESTLSEELQHKILKKINIEQKINIDEKKLEIKKSNITDTDYGVFALEKIPADTIFMYCDTGSIVDQGIGYFINDLAYHGDSIDYETDENITNFINVGHIRQSDQLYDFFGQGVCKIYLYAIKDIDEGEELSKFYGLNYWQEHEFWKEFPNSQFRVTHKMEDLPSKWVFIDTIRRGINFNHEKNLFAKKINDKYFYLVGYGGKYYKPNFPNETFVEITKPDFSLYLFNECIDDEMYLTEYLITKEHSQ